jgi:uncharacterized protein YukE
MAATSIPGLDVIQAAATRLGIDISDTIAKAQQIMAADPATIRAGSAQLHTVASGLDSTGQDLRTTGAAVSANWTGSTADAFTARHADLVGQVGGHQAAASGTAGQLDAAATSFEGGQQIVLTATGVAATAIRAQQVTA